MSNHDVLDAPTAPCARCGVPVVLTVLVKYRGPMFDGMKILRKVTRFFCPPCGLKQRDQDAWGVRLRTYARDFQRRQPCP